MSALGYSTAVGQAAIDAMALRLGLLEQNMPQPSSEAPLMITDANAPGTGIKFAREDHTHKSNTQAKRVPVAGSAGQATWEFSPAFDAVPVVDCTAGTPANATYINVASIVQSSVTMSSATIVVVRIVKSFTLPMLATSLLGLVLSVFGFAPADTYVNCVARKPS